MLTTAINAVQLVRLQRRREIFRTLEIRPDSPYLEYFLDFQAADIRRFFPRFQYDTSAPEAGRLVVLVLRDLVPAGMLLGTIRGERLDVHLDYVVPQFRDVKVGRFLFTDEIDFFRSRGIREIVSPADTTEHAQYLERIGFTRQPDGTYRLAVSSSLTGIQPPVTQR
jgi:GNAT superfamily N-acetyltransferase